MACCSGSDSDGRQRGGPAAPAGTASDPVGPVAQPAGQPLPFVNDPNDRWLPPLDLHVFPEQDGSKHRLIGEVAGLVASLPLAQPLQLIDGWPAFKHATHVLVDARGREQRAAARRRKGSQTWTGGGGGSGVGAAAEPAAAAAAAAAAHVRPGNPPTAATPAATPGNAGSGNSSRSGGIKRSCFMPAEGGATWADLLLHVAANCPQAAKDPAAQAWLRTAAAQEQAQQQEQQQQQQGTGTGEQLLEGQAHSGSVPASAPSPKWVFTAHEVRRALLHTSFSPGPDGVPVGLWRWAKDRGVAAALAALFTAMAATGRLPAGFLDAVQPHAGGGGAGAGGGGAAAAGKGAASAHASSAGAAASKLPAGSAAGGADGSSSVAGGTAVTSKPHHAALTNSDVRVLSKCLLNRAREGREGAQAQTQAQTHAQARAPATAAAHRRRNTGRKPPAHPSQPGASGSSRPASGKAPGAHGRASRSASGSAHGGGDIGHEGHDEEAHEHGEGGLHASASCLDHHLEPHAPPEPHAHGRAHAHAGHAPYLVDFEHAHASPAASAAAREGRLSGKGRKGQKQVATKGAEGKAAEGEGIEGRPLQGVVA